MTTKTLLIVLGLANIPVYVLVGWVFFNNLAGFLECFGISLTPEYKVTFNRDVQVDVFWAKMKIFFFLLVCALAVYGEYRLIHKYFLS